MEPTADERERAMGFATGVTAVPSISEASRRQVLGQAMDLNCLTWILSLGMAEQRRLRATSVVLRPIVSSLPTGTVEALAGGEESSMVHPWSTWDVMDEHVESVSHTGVFRSDDGVLEHVEEVP
jgi:hypothetical protein